MQSGACIYDDINKKPISGIDRFKKIVDVENAYPLSYIEQIGLTEVTVENSTACYSGALMLQAMGLGGWMFNGLNPFSILGASGDPEVPGCDERQGRTIRSQDRGARQDARIHIVILVTRYRDTDRVVVPIGTGSIVQCHIQGSRRDGQVTQFPFKITHRSQCF